MRIVKCLLFILFFNINIFGDIIIIELQKADICVRVINLDKYPNVALISLNECMPPSSSRKANHIKKNSCIKVYKLCPLKIYAVNKDYLSKYKNINEIDWEKDEHVLKSNVGINGKTFETFEPISEVEISLKIIGFTDTSIVLFKSSQVYKYNNGLPDSIQNFECKKDISKLKKFFPK